MMWIWLGLFALSVALLGGSSRHDSVQLLALRPLSALFLIPALYLISIEQLRQAKVLLLLLLLAALWTGLQLVPLPPAIWHQLPQRELIAEMDVIVGVSETWRPISLAPSRGWNALAGLILPIAAIVLALSMKASSRSLLLLVVGLAVLDALLGLAQVFTGRSSPLYFYAYTNRGAPVGIFANENHSAVFSALALLLIARLASTARDAKDPVWLRVALPPAFLLVLLSILASSSRAGFLMAGLAVISSGLCFWLALSQKRRGGSRNKAQDWLARHPRVLLGVFALLIGGLLAAFYQLDRAPGLEGLVSRNSFDDLRLSLWPVLSSMASDFFWLGSGFGSFEHVYHIYEPTELMLPSYVNQAHNDWVQIVIEGGVPAALLVIWGLGWIGLRLLALLRSGGSSLGTIVFWGASAAILCSASLVDYPLRAPTFQLVVAWLLLSLALDKDVSTT